MVHIVHHQDLTIDTYREVLARFNGNVVQLSAGKFCGRITLAALDGCVLMQSFSNLRALVFGQVRDEIGLYFPLDDKTFFADGRHYHPHEQLVTTSQRKIVTLRPENSHRLIIGITYELARSVLGASGYRRFMAQARKVEKDGLICRGKSQLATELGAFMRQLVESGPDASKCHQLAATLVQRLNQYFCDEDYFQPEPTRGPHRIVRRALEVLTNSTSRHIDLDMLSKEVFASRRNLTYAFNQLLDMPPKRFVKILKFNEIRKHIQDHQITDRVADLFIEYGSTNAARSMREYAEHFAEHPRETTRPGLSPPALHAATSRTTRHGTSG